jgi:hypothetical protein
MNLSETATLTLEQKNSISAHILLSYCAIIVILLFAIKKHFLKIPFEIYQKYSQIFIALIIIVTALFNMLFFKKSLTSDQTQIVKLNKETSSIGEYFNCKVNCYPSLSNIISARFNDLFNDVNLGYNSYTILSLTITLILTYYFWSKLYTGMIVGLLTFMPLPIIISLERIENTFSISVLTPLILIFSKTRGVIKSSAIILFILFGLQYNPQIIMYLVPVLIFLGFRKAIINKKFSVIMTFIIFLSIYLQRDFLYAQVLKQVDFGSGYIPSINFEDYYGYEATKNKSFNDIWLGMDLNILKNQHMGYGMDLQNYLIILGVLTVISIIYFLFRIDDISKEYIKILTFFLTSTIVLRMLFIREYYFTESFNLWPRSTMLIQYLIFIIVLILVFEISAQFVKTSFKNNVYLSPQKLQRFKLATNLYLSAIIVYQLAYIYW